MCVWMPSNEHFQWRDIFQEKSWWNFSYNCSFHACLNVNYYCFKRRIFNFFLFLSQKSGTLTHTHTQTLRYTEEYSKLLFVFSALYFVVVMQLRKLRPRSILKRKIKLCLQELIISQMRWHFERLMRWSC